MTGQQQSLPHAAEGQNLPVANWDGRKQEEELSWREKSQFASDRFSAREEDRRGGARGRPRQEPSPLPPVARPSSSEPPKPAKSQTRDPRADQRRMVGVADDVQMMCRRMGGVADEANVFPDNPDVSCDRNVAAVDSGQLQHARFPTPIDYEDYQLPGSGGPDYPLSNPLVPENIQEYSSSEPHATSVGDRRFLGNSHKRTQLTYGRLGPHKQTQMPQLASNVAHHVHKAEPSCEPLPTSFEGGRTVTGNVDKPGPNWLNPFMHINGGSKRHNHVSKKSSTDQMNSSQRIREMNAAPVSFPENTTRMKTDDQSPGVPLSNLPKVSPAEKGWKLDHDRESKASKEDVMKSIMAPKGKRSQAHAPRLSQSQKRRRASDISVGGGAAPIDIDGGSAISGDKATAEVSELKLLPTRTLSSRRRKPVDNCILDLDGDGIADSRMCVAADRAKGVEASQNVDVDNDTKALAAKEKEKDDEGEALRARWKNIGQRHLSVDFEKVRRKVTDRIEKFVNLQHSIHILNLDFCGLTCKALQELLPKISSSFTALEEFSMDDNQLDALPEEFGSSKELIAQIERLSLQRNLFSSVPEGILPFANIKWLDLSRNKLSSVSKGLFKLSKLEVVNLCENEISFVPSGIGDLRHLQILRLDANKLIELPQDIGAGNTQLTTIDVSENTPFFNGIPASMYALRDQLQYFYFSDTSLSERLPRKMHDMDAADLISLVAGKSHRDLLAVLEAKQQEASGRKGKPSSKVQRGEEIIVSCADTVDICSPSAPRTTEAEDVVVSALDDPIANVDDGIGNPGPSAGAPPSSNTRKAK